MIGYFKYRNKLFAPSTNNVYGFDNRISILENNEYKVTYYEIISGTSGTITKPTNTYFNSGEFGLSGNAILSKIDGSNKPTFETPKTLAGVPVTVSLNTLNGNYITSGVYTDASVAVIYSLNVTAADYQNLNYNYIIDYAEVQTFDNGLTTTSGGRTKLGGTLIENTVISGNYNFNTQWTDNTNINGFQVDNQHVKLYAYNGTNASTFQIHYNANGTSSDGSSNNVYIIDDAIGSKGLTGAGYYGANYTNNSYVQKQWISTNYQPLNANLTSWAGITRASGFDTFVATPTSSNFYSLLTTKTGNSSSLVFADSPTFTTDITTPKVIGSSGSLNLTTSVLTSGQTIPFVITPPTNTGQTSGINIPNFYIDTVTKTWAAGNITTQYWNQIRGCTFAFTSGSNTVSNSFSLFVEPAATTGTNLSAITNNWAIGASGNILSTSAISAANFIVSRSTTTSQSGVLSAENDNGSYARMNCYGSAFGLTAFRNNGAFGFKNSGYFITDGDVANSGTNSFYFLTGGYTPTTQTRLTIDSKGNTVQGLAALATNATDGFLYIESCAGTPTGVPTTYTGRVPMVYDTTNNKLYIYNGGWKSVTLA